jgi:hypothetical protein
MRRHLHNVGVTADPIRWLLAIMFIVGPLAA